jgi:hypothetical protein
MPSYEVHVFCDMCSGVHPTGITVELAHGPLQPSSIADASRGNELPVSVASLSDRIFQCPKMGRSFRQRDHDQILLVLIA